MSYYAYADIINDLRNLNPECSVEYPEIDDMKQNMLIMLYTTERKNLSADMENFALETKNFIIEFNKIYMENKKGDIEIKEKSIIECVNLRSKIPKNPKYIEEIETVKSANDVINKFIYNNAMFFENLGNNENATRKKIYYYKNASAAYEFCGETILATSLNSHIYEIERKYKNDMAKAKILVDEGLKELNSVNITEENIENTGMNEKIDAIVKFSSAREKFKDALSIYKSHNEYEKMNECKEKIEKIEKIMPLLQSNTFSFLFILLLCFFFITTYLFLRIKEWKDVMYDVSLGDEIMGKI